MRAQTVEIAEGDALVIPARFRRELGFAVGDSVVLEIADGELRVRSRHAAIVHAQELMRQLLPANTSLVDELIEDRRAEVTRERLMSDRYVLDASALLCLLN